MKLITLTQGKFAKVDDGMFEYLSQFKWYAKNYQGKFYANRKSKGAHIPMHLVVLGIVDKTYTGDLQGDHIDGDSLNNQSSNLRQATPSQNAANKVKCRGTSKYLGVSRKRGKWKVQVNKGGITYHVGMFEDEDDAGRAADKKRLELHGEFAQLNFKA